MQISHLKVDSPSRWGASAKALALIDAARARGIDVEADQYAYTAASSTLGIRFPSWALEGGSAQIAARLNDAGHVGEDQGGDAGRCSPSAASRDLSFAVVASYRADPSLNGLSMKQVAAKLKGADAADAQLEAARDMMLAGGASMVYHFMSDEDIDRIMRHPHGRRSRRTAACSRSARACRTRAATATTRACSASTCATRQVITLEEAVRKMTSLPADHFRLANRGRIVQGGLRPTSWSSIRATVGDAATFEQPHAYAAGIPYVLVNGVLVVKNGEHTGAKPGRR